jgi:hypothetical protein
MLPVLLDPPICKGLSLNLRSEAEAPVICCQSLSLWLGWTFVSCPLVGIAVYCPHLHVSVRKLDICCRSPTVVTWISFFPLCLFSQVWSPESGFHQFLKKSCKSIEPFDRSFEGRFGPSFYNIIKIMALSRQKK